MVAREAVFARWQVHSRSSCDQGTIDARQGDAPTIIAPGCTIADRVQQAATTYAPTFCFARPVVLGARFLNVSSPRLSPTANPPRNLVIRDRVVDRARDSHVDSLHPSKEDRP